jgi:tRNA (guanine-N1)-methyltransferase
LTGGELAAAVIADSVVRIIPGVIGDVESALSDSFQDNLLEPPCYTRPAEYHPVDILKRLGEYPKSCSLVMRQR